MPSISIASCVRVSVTVPPGSRSDGQLKRPCCRRLYSARNAGIATASVQLVRITHPFHPLAGRQLACVGERYNRSGKRLLLRVDDKTVCSVPPQWTDLAASDPEVVMGQGRALFRVVDLLELASLVSRLSGERGGKASDGCKDNFAANVKELMPQWRRIKP